MRVAEGAAWAHAGLSAAVVAFHMAAIGGARVGTLTMGGRWAGALPWPARGLSVLSAILIGAMGAVVLGRAGLLRWTPPGWTVWAMLGFSVLAVVANAATPSAPERLLWLPVTVLMLGAGALVALS